MSLNYRLSSQEPVQSQRSMSHRTNRVNVDMAIAGPSNQPSGSGVNSNVPPRDSGSLGDGNHSSVSSEGFCENEEEILQQSGGETDSHASSSPPVSSDDARRRVSNDDSVSDDDCQMYYYDAAAARRVASEGAGSNAHLHA
ncbi:PREDICTED: uncharacterized protein LOC106099433, partial [Papilio polytes]|uniref:uncharacterized protein LOC106099433 n=1 Tax=Papilio polytes TaxID=76194 RepID=UPI0006761D49